jgi:hypothetical protein
MCNVFKGKLHRMKTSDKAPMCTPVACMHVRMYVCIGNEQQNTGVHIGALSLVFIRWSFPLKTLHMLLIY